MGAFDTATQEGNSALGFVGNPNFARKIARWEINTNAELLQNAPGLLILP